MWLALRILRNAQRQILRGNDAQLRVAARQSVQVARLRGPPKSREYRSLNNSGAPITTNSDARLFLLTIAKSDRVDSTRSAASAVPGAQAHRYQCATQALAGSSPDSGFILVATRTSNRVAVLRTLPAIVTSASETTVCSSASKSRRSLTLWSC